MYVAAAVTVVAAAAVAVAGEVYGAEATMQAEPEPAEEADSLSDLELPSSACAYA